MTMTRTPCLHPRVSAFDAAKRDGFLVFRGRSLYLWDPYYLWCLKELRPYLTVAERTRYATVQINIDPCSSCGEVRLTKADTELFHQWWHALPGIKSNATAASGGSGGTWGGIPIPLARAFASDLFRVAWRRADLTRRYSPEDEE